MRKKITSTAKYWCRNLRTGEIKTFDKFYGLLNFYRSLQIKDLSAWSGWRHDAGYAKYKAYYQNAKMF